MHSVRLRRLAQTSRALAAALALVAFAARDAAAFENFTLLYGLKEYAEYTDNLFFTDAGQIRDVAINTVPDLSLLYDDGKTRWLARGSYRRESWIDNSEVSDNYWSFSGEFNRQLSGRVSVGLVGGWTRQRSLELASVLDEPGLRTVFTPSRGSLTTGTFWSPSMSVFWSRRFRTDLIYEDNQSFTRGSANTPVGGFGSPDQNSIDRSVTLAGLYAWSRRTTLRGILQASTNRNSGFPFASENDSNTYSFRVGFTTIVTPRLTLDLSAGPQVTDQINLPERVTLFRNVRIEKVDPVFGTKEIVFLQEPNQKVEAVSPSLALTASMTYQLDPRSRFTFDAVRTTTSGEGISGTQQRDSLSLGFDRSLSRRWNINVSGRYAKTTSIFNQFLITQARVPETGQQIAFDRETFDELRETNLKEFSFQPRLTYRLNRLWNAFAAWDFVDFDEGGLGGGRTRINRVSLGVEFRNEERF
jgi:hypothetical protein